MHLWERVPGEKLVFGQNWNKISSKFLKIINYISYYQPKYGNECSLVVGECYNMIHLYTPVHVQIYKFNSEVKCYVTDTVIK